MSFKDIFFKKSPFASHNSSHSDTSDNYKEWLKSQEVKKAECKALGGLESSLADPPPPAVEEPIVNQ